LAGSCHFGRGSGQPGAPTSACQRERPTGAASADNASVRASIRPRLQTPARVSATPGYPRLARARARGDAPARLRQLTSTQTRPYRHMDLAHATGAHNLRAQVPHSLMPVSPGSLPDRQSLSASPHLSASHAPAPLWLILKMAGHGQPRGELSHSHDRIGPPFPNARRCRIVSIIGLRVRRRRWDATQMTLGGLPAGGIRHVAISRIGRAGVHLLRTRGNCPS
jgi:hypothetical protein